MDTITLFLLAPYEWPEGKSVMTVEFGETGCVQAVGARYCRMKTLHAFPSEAYSCLMEFEGS